MNLKVAGGGRGGGHTSLFQGPQISKFAPGVVTEASSGKTSPGLQHCRD